ncbi:class I SAM-dependent methyltransferase [Pontibacter virosus]|uniref:Methyltransferase family protein n=1 Tax=Pontibacter virosus TaxID=1765052 RepID=A0A2U1ARP9_9BACT|nr:class I SAM-dependent methyltransferase [Pontibacter virosus]PVY39031.1 methyltransferase family protein [Pontibacter virosus]
MGEKLELGEEWFSNQKLLSKVLNKYVDKSKPLRFIEIGSWKGRSAIWFLENYLGHEASKIYCIDTWDVSAWNDYNTEKAFIQANAERAAELKVDSLFNIFINNIQAKGFSAKCIPIRKKSVEALQELEDHSFDFAYVDGDHSAQGCYEDLVACWPKVKKGGVMFGDDWTWKDDTDNSYPVKQAANRFAKEFNVSIKPFFKRGNGFYFVKK